MEPEEGMEDSTAQSLHHSLPLLGARHHSPFLPWEFSAKTYPKTVNVGKDGMKTSNDPDPPSAILC
jgi:hypothetical protein